MNYIILDKNKESNLLPNLYKELNVFKDGKVIDIKIKTPEELIKSPLKSIERDLKIKEILTGRKKIIKKESVIKIKEKINIIVNIQLGNSLPTELDYRKFLSKILIESFGWININIFIHFIYPDDYKGYYYENKENLQKIFPVGLIKSIYLV